jgi:hypothetical protein
MWHCLHTALIHIIIKVNFLSTAMEQECDYMLAGQAHKEQYSKCIYEI